MTDRKIHVIANGAKAAFRVALLIQAGKLPDLYATREAAHAAHDKYPPSQKSSFQVHTAHMNA